MMAYIDCSRFIQNPKKIIYGTFLLICLGISIYQLIGCMKKLQDPPVTTHYSFDVNETMYYPAITICRTPPLKDKVLKEYNLGEMNSEIEESAQWNAFPFEKISLQRFWELASYKQEEVIWMYGLHGFSENAEVRKSFYYHHGQCFTLIPRAPEVNHGQPERGWSIMLGHDMPRTPKRILFTLRDNSTKVPSTKVASTKPKLFRSGLDQIPGFHIYIHSPREPYIENKGQTQSIMEYMYLEVGEDLEIKISGEHYKQVSRLNKPCIEEIDYSATKCSEHRRWKQIAREVGCVGPWMNGIHAPQCHTSESLRQLLKRYTQEENIDRGCNKSCSTVIYKLFVVNRIPNGRLKLSNLFVYYSSKVVATMEEKLGYDWNSFLSDIGGSLGFFLGLSVIGIIDVFEGLFHLIFGCARKKKNAEPEIEIEKKDDENGEKKLKSSGTLNH